MILLAALLVSQCCVSGSAAAGGSPAGLERIEDCSTSCSQVKQLSDHDTLTLASFPQARHRAVLFSRCEWRSSWDQSTTCARDKLSRVDSPPDSLLPLQERCMEKHVDACGAIQKGCHHGDSSRILWCTPVLPSVRCLTVEVFNFLQWLWSNPSILVVNQVLKHRYFYSSPVLCVVVVPWDLCWVVTCIFFSTLLLIIGTWTSWLRRHSGILVSLHVSFTIPLETEVTQTTL